MQRSLFFPVFPLCLLCNIGAAQNNPPVPTVLSLEQRAARIRPTDAETRWQQIPWLRSVIEGQQAARRENRPIMYWHVDDDPLERC